MVILSPLGTPGTYCETGSSRLSLFSWGQLHDHRGRHRLRIRSDPEMSVGARRACSAQQRGAVVRCELTLGCAQENHGAGDQKFVGGLIHHGLQRSLIDRLERRRTVCGTRTRACCKHESNTQEKVRWAKSNAERRACDRKSFLGHVTICS